MRTADAIAIRRLAPGDAPALARCFERCYGRSYVVADLCDPAAIAALIAAGSLHSMIATRGR